MEEIKKEEIARYLITIVEDIRINNVLLMIIIMLIAINIYGTFKK